MHEKTQDAMTYVKTYGRPDLFITFTCNLKWTEISEVLLPCQAANHRHDIVARIFCQKVIKLMGILTKSARIFGKMQCDMYSIEWQKRGLPHAHILLWLKEKIRPNQIDDIIFAELPAPREDPKLFEVVKTQMVHGPSGRFNPHSPCMDVGNCTKRFPRELLNETQTGQDGYPLYRHRKPEDGGFTTKIKARSRGGGLQEMEIENRWIVPYNPSSPALSRPTSMSSSRTR